MKCSLRSATCLLIVAALLASDRTASATVIDDFETGYVLSANMNGVNGWSTHTGPGIRQVVVDPTDAGNHVMEITNRDGSIDTADLKAVSIPDGALAVFSFRMFTPAIAEGDEGPDVNLGLTAGTTGAGNNGSGDWGPYLRIDGDGNNTTTPRNLKLRPDGTSSTVGNYADATWYTVTMDINNQAKSYTISLEGGTFGAGTLLEVGGSSTINFRNTGIGAINNIWLRPNGGHDDDGGQTLFVDDFNLTFDTPLKVLVHPATGEVILTNPSLDAVDFNSYQIDSPLGSLQKADGKWNSLDDQNLDPVGAGVGQTWDESGFSGPTSVGEQFLLGSTELAGGASISLGELYNAAAPDLGLTISYNDLAKGVVAGDVEFVLLGDMDGNGTLEDADVNPFVEALTNRVTYDTNNPGVMADFVGDFDGNGQLDLGDVALFKAAILALPGTASSSAVPEPSTFALLGLTIIGLLGKRRRVK